MQKMDSALLLAGGLGTRLRPITNDIPKVMAPVQGKPILEYNIALCKKHGIKNIVIVIGHKGEKIMDYFGNGEKFGVKINYAGIETESKGTAHAIFISRELLKDRFVVFNGDNLSDIDLTLMNEFHENEKKIATLALVEMPDVENWGVAKVYAQLSGSLIMYFVEKPKHDEAPSNLINAGVYIFEQKIFDYLEKAISLEHDVFPKLAEDGQLICYIHESQWFPTDTMEKYTKAQREWKGLK